MSYSMGSIDCLAVEIDEKYLECLKEDVKNGIYTDLELEDFDSPDVLREIDGFEYYDEDENYAYVYKVDVETGKVLDGGDYFNGYVLPFYWFPKNIYEKSFENKDDILEQIKMNMYIPTNWSWQDNIIFLTGVWGG